MGNIAIAIIKTLSTKASLKIIIAILRWMVNKTDNTLDNNIVDEIEAMLFNSIK